VGREDAEEEPRRGSGVAEIDDIIGLCKTAEPDPVDQPAAVFGADDPGAHRAQRGRGCQHVLAFEEPRYLGAADGERAEHQRAVRNRFVARHPDRAGQRRRRARRDQRGRRRGNR